MLYQGLATKRTGNEESIKVRFHYDHVDKATERLKEQIKFPMCGAWNLGDVIAAYHNYMPDRASLPGICQKTQASPASIHL